MSDIIKKIKIKKQDGTFTDYIPIGAEAENVNVDGESVEVKLNKTPYYYNSVADMKTDEKLKVGDMAITLGYYEANDGGNAEYRIVSGNYIDDGGNYHKLNNNLYAILVVNDKINVKQFGAKGNGVDDDTNFIQLAINTNSTIFFPNGTYSITEPLIINTTKTILGESDFNTKISKKVVSTYNKQYTYNEKVFDFSTYNSVINIVPSNENLVYYVNIENLQIIGSKADNSCAIAAPGIGYCNFKNLRITNHYHGIIWGGWVNTFHNCKFFTCYYAYYSSNVSNIATSILEGSSSEANIKIWNGNNLNFKNVAVDNGRPCFYFVDCNEVCLEGCSTETYGSVLTAENSRVFINNCKLETHGGSEQFFSITNDSEISINNCHLQYATYSDPERTTPISIASTTKSVLKISNCTYDIPIGYTSYTGGSGKEYVQIDDYIYTNLKKSCQIPFNNIEVPANVPTGTTSEIELARLSLAYGDSLMINVNGFGVKDMVSLILDTKILTYRHGTPVVNVQDNSKVISSSANPVIAINATYDTDTNEIVLTCSSNLKLGYASFPINGIITYQKVLTRNKLFTHS